MSNIIPMVSSSPPPMDEGGGFQWDDDDDDFGTFASAGETAYTQSEPSVNQDTSLKNISEPDCFSDDAPHENDLGNFADFESFSIKEADGFVNKPKSETILNDHRPESIHIAQNSLNESEAVHVNTESNSYHCVNGPLVDSGVYSSNVSPVQLVEASGTTKDHVNKTTDGNDKSTALKESLHDLKSTLLDNSKHLVDSNEFNMETINENESSVSPQASLSVTQENVTTIIDSEIVGETVCEETYLQEDSKSIPMIVSIPENLDKNMSDNDQNETATVHTNIPIAHAISADNVILNSDVPCIQNQNSDILKYKLLSEEKFKNVIQNSQSVPNVDSQKFSLSQNVGQTDLGESKFSTIDIETCNVEQSDRAVIRTEEVLEAISDERDSDSDMGQECGQEICDECESSGFSLERVDAESTQTVCDTRKNSVGENETKVSEVGNDRDKINQEQAQIIYDQARQDENTESVADDSTASVTNTFDNDSGSENRTEDKVSLEQKPSNMNSSFSDSKTDEAEMINADIESNMSAGSVIIDKDVDNLKYIPQTPLQEDTLPTDEISDRNIEDQNDFDDSNACLDSKEVNCSSVLTVENDDDEFGDFNATNEDTGSDYGDFNASFDNKENLVSSTVNDTDEDFEDFNANCDKVERQDEDIDAFNATFDNAPTISDQTNDWAAFSEPQTVINDDIEDDADDWAGFQEDDTRTAHEPEPIESTDVLDKLAQTQKLVSMTKSEKLMYAVTMCFPSLVSDLETNNVDLAHFSDLHIESESHVWGHVNGQRTTDALSYVWTKSTWNSQLFSTLHIDTRNIFIGHKKAPVPVFATGLTMLEPTKRQTLPTPDVLVDMSTSASSLSPQQSQIPSTSVLRANKNEWVPVAQFDWSTSGLTNPLEANNKTLNLDFLIQDQATKSNALESEFLTTSHSPVHKPAIQPLQNILANLKSSSTFKPTNQIEDISQEASKLVQSLPDLVFMKSKVLMFPMKMSAFGNQL